MNIEKAEYNEFGRINVVVDGTAVTVPDELLNRYRVALAKWEDEGNLILPFSPPPLTGDDVRVECQRRLIALVGARDAGHLATIKSNGQEEASALMWILVGGGQLTGEQTTRAAQLSAARDAFEAIRAASNVLEIMEPIPSDYTDDKHWS